MRSEPDFDMLCILARSVGRRPLLYCCIISFFVSIVIAFFTISSFLSFFGASLITISEINYIKHFTDRNDSHKLVYLGSD